MKYLSVLFLTATLGCAADFYTGQAARLVIGQPTFTSQDSGASETLVGAVGGLAYANDTLFVVDANRVGATPINNRVLIYRNISTSIPQPTDALPVGPRCPVCTGTASVVLGQTDFTKTDIALTQSGMRLPTAVASDGTVLAVADTDNNRVLIWRSIPTSNGAPADVVVGQADFKSSKVSRPPSASSLRGPQGVWIQNGKLFVADTQNHRVLIWNSIPTSNGQAANVVLGQPGFDVTTADDLAQKPIDPQPNNLLNPVSVTSDGQRLYVSDLGHNRVLIWNSIPSSNQAPADVVVGQPDMTSSIANNVTKLCESNGTDEKGNATYPPLCAATLDFPRFALSDGQRLFIADGGNDRVLVYNVIPTTNGASADKVLGQFTPVYNNASDNADPLRRSSSDSLRTPMSLAWDGVNLYVSDPFNRRVMVFTAAEPAIPYNGVRNAASRDVFAVGLVTLSGTITADNEVTVKIGEKEYKHKVAKNDTILRILQSLLEKINAGEGDPLVIATPNYQFNSIILTSRRGGESGNNVEYSASVSTDATITVSTSGSKLTGGMDAAKIAPGTLVSLLGERLAETVASAPPGADPLPRELAGVQVYFDGIRAPLLYVSPTQINAQIPYEVSDTTSINAYVRVAWSDGRVTITGASAVPIIGQNPGIFAEDGPDPRPAIAFHSSSAATGTISVDGTASAGNVATVIIEDREYSYTIPTVGKVTLGGTIQADDEITLKIGDIEYKYKIVSGDTLANAVAQLAAKVNAGDGNADVVASADIPNLSLILTARTPSKAGSVTFTVSASANAKVTVTPTNGGTLAEVRDGLIAEINKDPKVMAFPAGLFTRIRLKARVEGPEGNEIRYSTKVSDGANVILSPTNITLCCANQAYSRVTEDNPALPGETIIVYATGLGLVSPDEAKKAAVTGAVYKGPELNQPIEMVSSLAGGKTANVLAAGLKPGTIGIYEVHLELLSDLPTNPRTEFTIAQDVYVSNIATIPVVNPTAVVTP